MNTALGILLAVVGAGMIGFWAVYVLKGGLTQGIRTLENGGFIAFHITAEVLTGILCIAGGTTLALSISLGIRVALLACGMLLYTSINSLAWKEVKNRPAVSVMFIVPAVIALLSIVYLLLLRE